MWRGIGLLPVHVTSAAAAETSLFSVSSQSVLTVIFDRNYGDFVQRAVYGPRMSEHKAEEAIMAAHAVSNDGVRGGDCVVLSHHRR